MLMWWAGEDTESGGNIKDSRALWVYSISCISWYVMDAHRKFLIFYNRVDSIDI